MFDFLRKSFNKTFASGIENNNDNHLTVFNGHFLVHGMNEMIFSMCPLSLGWPDRKLEVENYYQNFIIIFGYYFSWNDETFNNTIWDTWNNNSQFNGYIFWQCIWIKTKSRFWWWTLKRQFNQNKWALNEIKLTSNLTWSEL